MASCTFLNPRARGALLAELRPAHRGRVPAALYWAILLDVTAVGLVVPLLSRYSRELGGGPTFTGVLQATYGLTQLLGANLLGGLSDAKGRRPLLLTSELGGLVGYLCLAGSLHPALRPSGAALYFLLASRLPIGLFKQSLTVARALVADCTAPEGRMRAMSKLGAMVGCGFVLGPAFGGALSKIVGLAAPPLLAACLFALALTVTFFLVPETAPLPATLQEIEILAASAERRWRVGAAADAAAAAHRAHLAHQPPPPTAPPTGRLSVGDAKAACAVSLKEWRPNGEQVTEVLSADGVTAVLEKWHGALDVAAVAEKVGGGSGDALPWATWRASLVMAYAQAKEAEGMLPRGGAAEAIEQANAAYRRDAAAGEAAAAAAAAAARGAAGAAAAARAQLSEGWRGCAPPRGCRSCAVCSRRARSWTCR